MSALSCRAWVLQKSKTARKVPNRTHPRCMLGGNLPGLLSMQQAGLQDARVPQPACTYPLGDNYRPDPVCHAGFSSCNQQNNLCCLRCSTHHSATKNIWYRRNKQRIRVASLPPFPYIPLEASNTACPTSCPCLKVPSADYQQVRLDWQAPWHLNAAATSSRSCWDHGGAPSRAAACNS